MLLQHLAKLNHYFFPFTKVSWGNFIFKCVQIWPLSHRSFLNPSVVSLGKQNGHISFGQQKNQEYTSKVGIVWLRTTWSPDVSICKLELYLWLCPFQGSNAKRQKAIVRVVPNQFMALPGTTQLYTITPFCKIKAEVFKWLGYWQAIQLNRIQISNI